MRFLSLFAFLGLVVAQDCNICGDGNTIQYPQGSVEFIYNGEKRKNNCQTWQKIVENPVTISDDFCRNELLQYTHFICRCTDPFGNAVVWIPPTEAPTSGPPSVALNAEEQDTASTSQAALGGGMIVVGLSILLNILS